MSSQEEVDVVRDGIILGMIFTGAAGAVIVGSALIHFLIAVKSRPIDRKMFWSSFLTMLFLFLFCLGAALWRTDILFDIAFDTSDIACEVSFDISYIFYGLSKTFLMAMFSYRIQLVFEQSPHLSVDERYLKLIRWSVFVLTFIVLFGVAGFLPKVATVTKSGDIWLCTGDTGFNLNFGNMSIIGFVLLDLLFSGLLLFLYVKKLYTVAKTLLHMGDGLKPSYSKLITQLVKSNVLAATAVLSTWIFFMLGMFVYPDIGWFVPVDATINAASVYLMFNFSEKLYLLLCKPCALGCYCCFAGWDAAQEAAHDERFLKVRLGSTISNTGRKGTHEGNRSPSSASGSGAASPSAASPSSFPATSASTDFDTGAKSGTESAGETELSPTTPSAATRAVSLPSNESMDVQKIENTQP